MRKYVVSLLKNNFSKLVNSLFRWALAPFLLLTGARSMDRNFLKGAQMVRLKKPTVVPILIFTCLVTAGLLIPGPLWAAETIEFELAWKANNEGHLSGYEIHFKEGTESSYKLIGDVYLDQLEDPANPKITITNLFNGAIDESETTILLNKLTDNTTYYFALTAFDSLGKVSDFSEEICVEIDETTVSRCRTAAINQRISGGSSGGGGGSDQGDLVDLKSLGCFISALDSEPREIRHLSGVCLILFCFLTTGTLVLKSN